MCASSAQRAVWSILFLLCGSHRPDDKWNLMWVSPKTLPKGSQNFRISTVFATSTVIIDCWQTNWNLKTQNYTEVVNMAMRNKLKHCAGHEKVLLLSYVDIQVNMWSPQKCSDLYKKKGRQDYWAEGARFYDPLPRHDIISSTFNGKEETYWFDFMPGCCYRCCNNTSPKNQTRGHCECFCHCSVKQDEISAIRKWPSVMSQ